MKKILLFTTLCVLFISTKAQVYTGDLYFFNQTEVDQFVLENPNIAAIEGNVELGELSDLSGLSQLQSISGTLTINSFDLSYLQDLQSLNSVYQLQIFNSEYSSSLDNFTDQFTFVVEITFDNCTGDLTTNSSLFENLTELSTLEFISCFENWNFPGLSSLFHYTASQTSANISLPNLTFLLFLTINGDDMNYHPLPYLPLVTQLDALQLYNVNLPDNFNNISNIQVINNFDIYNLIAFSGFTGLSQLSTITGNFTIGGSDLLTDFSDLSSLTAINGSLSISFCTFNSLDGLQSLQNIGAINFEENYALDDITALNQASISFGVWISNCPNLQYCNVNSICNYIAQNSDAYISNNSVGCNSTEEISSLCAAEANFTGNVFYDINCNQIQEIDEPTIPNLNIQVTPSMGVSVLYMDQGFILAAPANTDLTITTEAFNGFEASEHTINSSTTTGNLNFGLCTTSSTLEAATLLYSYDELRPGFEYDIHLCVANQASEIIDGTLTLTLPENILLSPLQTDGGTVSGNTISWVLSSIQPFQQQCFTVTSLVNIQTTLGSEASFSAVFVPSGTDINIENNTVIWETTVIGSYDPNDKQVNLTSINATSLAPQESVELIYTVRFQNTGNASAINIRVEDIIEEDLDITSLQMIEASHDYSYEINGNTVIWYFDNINLPDATSNEEGSHGTFSFHINSTGNQIAGSIIENNVSIFFDFNDPVITNTATTTYYVCPDAPVISGATEVCGLDVVMFSTPDNNYPIINWFFEDVFISSASQIPMAFAMPGDYEIILEVGDENCTTTTSILVTAYEVPEVEIFNMDNTLFTQVIADTYQWYLNGNPIEGATESVYNPTEPGIYSLFVVFESGCENESNAINFNVGIEEINNITFSVFPNPFDQTIYVNSITEVAIPIQIEIYDMIGNKVFSNTYYQKNNELEISSLASGAYFFKVIDADGKINSSIIEKK